MNAHPQLTDGGATEGKALPQVPPLARLLRLPEVMDRVGLRRSAIYQRMSEGRFPKSRSLGPKCAVWVEAEINDWIDEIARGNT
ncbi:AlpA family transcriptional regulator [Novosphingobium pentaromativorans]|jgi:prophage regulatory protein|uniref:Putative transcriptional regulator n=1 Tax=Novosphingobium pentaromativorans US6-1 TaxID=1088721 RepID=G6EF65_9SPHN|nr:AlpA family transcriptional regulator [Novosphingobium pentaromativorans]AIT79204.1 transcriptional regulator [Novosphingobium pentaromativorans US6-1]EHJ60023.1 putative transcriptional regulator [Novosphingobium pentaromativorans US6-1]